MTRIASTVALLALCVGLARAGTPSVTIAQTSGTTHYGTTDSLTGTVTFSEAVYTTGAADAAFESDDLTLSGCTLDTGGFVETTAGTVWSFVLTPSGTSDCTVDVAVNEAHSTATDTDNSVSNTLTYTFKPTATIACAHATLYGANAHDNTDAACTVTLTHANAGTGAAEFASGDITLNKGAVTSFAGSSTDFTFTLDIDGGTTGSDADITVDIAADAWAV